MCALSKAISILEIIFHSLAIGCAIVASSHHWISGSLDLSSGTPGKRSVYTDDVMGSLWKQ
jgi:hypothetical protein